MKRWFSIVLCVGLLCTLAIPVSASSVNERLLEYDHIDTITANLTIDRFWGIASCDGSIDACGDYPVYVEVYLQKNTDNGWETLEIWTNAGQIRANANGRYAIAKGYQYRTCTVGYVYDDNGNIIDSAYATYAVTYN